MNCQEMNDTVESSLARSALYGTLAALYRRPDNPLFRSFRTEQELDALLQAVACSGLSNTAHLSAAARQVQWAARDTTIERLLNEFIRLFGHVSRGTVPPYETEYGSGGPFFQPQEMSDIAGFYRAFGLDIDAEKHERMDHICCECEFLCFLCAKQAYALEAGENETALEVARAHRLFLRDHLAPFGRTFLARVRQQPGIIWHPTAARFGAAFLDGECARFEIQVDRAYLPLRPTQDFDVPMACGSCGAGCETTVPPEA